MVARFGADGNNTGQGPSANDTIYLPRGDDTAAAFGRFYRPVGRPANPADGGACGNQQDR